MHPHETAKNELQEYCQSHTLDDQREGHLPFPIYKSRQVQQSQHSLLQPEFKSKATITAHTGKMINGRGRGKKKREAEKFAALDAIVQLKNLGLWDMPYRSRDTDLLQYIVYGNGDDNDGDDDDDGAGEDFRLSVEGERAMLQRLYRLMKKHNITQHQLSKKE